MPTVVHPDLHTFAADLSALLRDRPALSTPAIERAAWFDRKADLLERVASTTPEAAELATAAREEAARLRTGTSA
ncbi:hypothetical protein [Actinoplanes campanulatus]|uniref:hypothetical protein n=1 Tax=Actinoplanes campanulatus TaxID=113559 RepID=UPI001954FBD4|nr:hypothetical protein [Actinoplanes capillaceus]